MKIGYKTRLWGIRLEEISNTLDLIAEAGFHGVEFSQRPDSLGVDDIEELISLLKERNLTLLSLTNGTLIERKAFLKHHLPEYLYINYWDVNAIPDLVEQGFTPALHPGMFTPIRRIDGAQSLLDEYPQLKLICDTAHLTIAGEDPGQSVKAITDSIVAVHLQDWTPEFGRSGPRYGRGFRRLGDGVVNLDSVLEVLREEEFDGWIVAEVGETNDLIADEIAFSVEWFTKRGLLVKSRRLTKSVCAKPRSSFPPHRKKCPPEAEAHFREDITLAAAGKADAFYEKVARAFYQLFSCEAAMIWLCSPAQDQMGLLVSIDNNSTATDEGAIIRPQEVLTGIAIDRQAPMTYFDLTTKDPGQSYGYPNRHADIPDSLKKTNLKHMLSIPIYSADKQNYPRLLVNLFLRENKIPMTEGELFGLARSVAIASDARLDTLCSIATARVNLLAGQCNNSEDFLRRLTNLIQTTLDCYGTAIFLVNEVGDKLELAESSGTKWFVPEKEQFYREGEGLTGRVWKQCESLLTIDSLGEWGHKGKSEESVPTAKEHTCIWVPFVDSRGEVMAVVRCRNKRTVPNLFSDDDAAILDAIGQAAVPHLHILLEKERNASALGRLTHELKTPIVAIRGAAEFMMRTEGVKRFFDYDYPGDIWSWSELMRRLLGNADLFQYSSVEIPIRAVPTFLMGDVIAAAVKQVKLLLRERNFSPQRINYSRFEQVPRLYIDPNQFQQVMFNLLSNAIKHCYDDPDAFQVEITGVSIRGYFLIKFSDWGPGIAREAKDLIFEEGFRSREARDRNVTGQGLGLWVVRRIVEAHGGKIRLTKSRLPTQFTIYLPRHLARRPPATE